MEQTPSSSGSTPGPEAGPLQWPPAAPAETFSPIAADTLPGDDWKFLHTAPVPDPLPAPTAETHAALEGDVLDATGKGVFTAESQPLALTAGPQGEVTNPPASAEQAAEAEASHQGAVRRVGAALAVIVDKGLTAAGEVSKSGLLDVVGDIAQSSQGKTGRVLHGVVTAGRTAAKIDEARRGDQKTGRDDDVVAEEVHDVSGQTSGSGFVSARAIPRKEEAGPSPWDTIPPPHSRPSPTPPRATPDSPPSGFWPPVSTESTTSPAAPAPAQETTSGSNDDSTAPTPAEAPTSPAEDTTPEPEPGRAESKVRYQPWQIENFDVLDELADLGIDPRLGLPINLEEILGDESRSKAWRERATWIANSRKTEGGEIEVNGRLYRRELPFIPPNAALPSPYAPDGPPVRTNRPEDRSLDNQKDYGKGRLGFTERVARGVRRVVGGSDREPGGRIAGRRWRRARGAGHAEVDAGGGLTADEVRARQQKTGYLHLDPNGPPVTAVEGGPWESSTRYRKLKFDRRGSGPGFDDHPSR